MAEITSQPSRTSMSTRQLPHAGMKIEPPQSRSSEAMRNNKLQLDVISPVNQNGSFEFDRVVKSGTVLKRTRKTKVQFGTYWYS